MAEFLTAAWIAELDAAARASASLRAFDGRLVVEQRVTATPGGDRSYHVVIGDGPAHVEPGAASAPDLVLRADYETAVAIHEGRENAQGAIHAGRLHVHGNLEKVLDHAEAIAALDDVFAEVRSGDSKGDSIPDQGAG